MHRFALAALLLLPAPCSPLAAQALRDTVERYTLDREALSRRYAVEYDAGRRQRYQRFCAEWQKRLEAIAYDRLDVEGRIDWQLLANAVRRQLALLELEARRAGEMQRLVPFGDAIMGLMETRRRLETVKPRETSATLAHLARQIDTLRTGMEAGEDRDTARAARIIALRGVGLIDALRGTLTDWYRYYEGYDPVFTWWNADPWKRADSALVKYARTLRRQVIGQKDGEDEPIIGDPIGADALRAELAFELIPYGPEDLLRIAEREFAWCEAKCRRLRASWAKAPTGRRPWNR